MNTVLYREFLSAKKCKPQKCSPNSRGQWKAEGTILIPQLLTADVVTAQQMTLEKAHGKHVQGTYCIKQCNVTNLMRTLSNYFHLIVTLMCDDTPQ